MTLDLANILGLAGSAIMVAAFAYSNAAKAIDLVLFNILNLAGAALLISSLLVHTNVASLLLEFAWAAIALIGLGKALIARARA